MLEDMVSSSFLWLTLLSIISSYVLSKAYMLLWWLILLVTSLSFLINNLLGFYLVFELSLIPILIMVLFWGSQPERLSAGLYFLIYTSMMSMPYMFMIMLLFPKNLFFMSSELFFLSSLLCLAILLPFLVKMPVLGLHFWLPKAHVEASTSGSMILAGLLLKLGSYGGFRLMFLANFFFYIKYFNMFWLLSAFLSSLITFMQSDMKKLVAYSSVTHMTFMMIGMLSINNSTLIGVLLLSLVHGWASMAMFAFIGTVSHFSNSRLAMMSSIESKFSFMVVLFGVILIANSSVPPMPSFFPELVMVLSVFMVTKLMIFFVGLSFFVCYYNVYIFMWVTHKKSLEKTPSKFSSKESSIMMMLVNTSIITLGVLQVL